VLGYGEEGWWWRGVGLGVWAEVWGVVSVLPWGDPVVVVVVVVVW
jgi:hypothetical protein